MFVTFVVTTLPGRRSTPMSIRILQNTLVLNAQQNAKIRQIGLFMTLRECIDELRESLKTHDSKMKDEHILLVLNELSLWYDLSPEAKTMELSRDMFLEMNRETQEN
jgi:hypothetical protein